MNKKIIVFILVLISIGIEMYPQKNYNLKSREDSLDYIDMLYEKGLNAFEHDEYKSGMKYLKELEEYIKIKPDSNVITNDDIFISGYGFLIEFYKRVGMWKKAIGLQKSRTNYWEHLYINKTSRYSWEDFEMAYQLMFRRLIEIICLSGNYKMALREIKKYKGNSNEMNREKGKVYLLLNDFDNAMNYFQKSNDSFNLAKIHYYRKEYQDALKLQKALFKEEEKVKGHKIAITLNTSDSNISGDYDTYLCYLSKYFNINEQFDSTLVYEKRHYLPSVDNIAFSFMNVGQAYVGLKQWDKAIDNFIHANNIYKQQSQNRLNAKAMADLSNCYYKTGEITLLSNCVSELLGYASMDLFDTFQELTYDERSKYIGEYSDIMNVQIPRYAYSTKSDSIIAYAYNAALTMKNALLSSEKSMRRIIAEKHDSILNAQWEELKADKNILKKQISLEEKKRRYNTDSLYRVIEDLEDSLIVRCKEYGDITREMRLNWADIQKELAPEDIAIEFLSFPVSNDSTMYVALSLRKDSKTPKMTILFEQKQIHGLSDTVTANRITMADLIWEPLRSELEGTKNIYFSPSGMLHNIGIEHLPGMEGYRIYRLSSTRELAIKNTSKNKDNTILYGGLRYDMTDDGVSTQKDDIVSLDDFYTEKSDVLDIGIRGGKEYLEQTKVEVEQIGKELELAHKTYEMFTEYEGTEESFKELSGRPIRTLHISTHGFYYTAEEVEDNKLSLLQLNDESVSYEDKQLTRSGLVMAGANRALELEDGEELPYDAEDGLLTAKEIADIDLRGLDLVVLSACQTALGDLSQSEGVFGLQRGFKKAGANSILMSLWKVDDEATQIFMTQFYKNYLSGQSKHEALKTAQKYLREYENGRYNKPKYWAAFILLDGVDN